MSFIARRGSLQALWILGVLLTAAPVLALQPDEIALVVNARVPDGRALAEFYARERHIPDGRIIEVSVDPDSVISPAEQMPFDAYEPQVAVPIRNYLIQNHLRERVKCLVTFWGMPMRIGRREMSPLARDELNSVTKELNDTRAGITQDVVALEQLAIRLDPKFKPHSGDELAYLARRFNLSLGAVLQALPTVKDSAARNATYAQVVTLVDRLLGPDRATELAAQPAMSLFTLHPPTTLELTESHSRLEDVERKLARSQTDSATPADREKAREIARGSVGSFGYAFVVMNQQLMISDDQTESALDSELSLLWSHDYPKTRWVQNSLEWRYQAASHGHLAPATPSALMVTRLDGPSLDIVHNIILTSLKVEAQGLHGQVAIDARGKTGNDPYAEYDQKLRDLADLLSKKTTLKVMLDNKDSLIPAHSLSGIAVYCGWYSLENFSSPGTFSPGAVGFHIASLECVSLRRPKEHGWVRGLLSEGVVGTLGPVAEPFLQSFPPPDEFVPLLMTGKVTLAEAYWRTLPWSSWMQLCIGDPLYNPFKNDPPLHIEDLPAPLRSAIVPATTQPATTTLATPAIQ